MARNLSDIKKEAQELSDSISNLKEEAVSFGDAKEKLTKAASAINNASDRLSVLSDNSLKMLEEVESVSTEKTLKEMRKSAKEMKQSSEEIKSIYENLTEDNNAAMAKMEKQLKIMGAVAIVCSLVAIILSLR